MHNSRIRGIVDTGRFDYGPERSKLLVRLWRILAKGRPLGPTQIDAVITATGMDPGDAEAFLRSISERDDTDRIVGLLGLSLHEHPHQFIIAGRTFSTWCAVDTLFLPAMLNSEAIVESQSPESARKIRVVIGVDGVRELDPPSAAVSLPSVQSGQVDTSSTQGIWSAFCQRIHFFADAAEARSWCKGRGEM